MISICRYTQDKHAQWDDFVKVSKNGTFLFLRAYMDYHSDRFHDHSLMFHNEKGKLIAVLPANIKTASLRLPPYGGSPMLIISEYVSGRGERL